MFQEKSFKLRWGNAINRQEWTLTLSASVSMALRTHPMVPSPPHTSTRKDTSGSKRHHSRPFSGEMSWMSITCGKTTMLQLVAHESLSDTHLERKRWCGGRWTNKSLSDTQKERSDVEGGEQTSHCQTHRKKGRSDWREVNTQVTLRHTFRKEEVM